MKRQTMFFIIGFTTLFACAVLVRSCDHRPTATALPIPAPVFIWPSEVSYEAN